MASQGETLSSSLTKGVKRNSLSLDEFVVIEPEVAGETPNEYCLQDGSRPRQFVPVIGFWSKLVPIGKAVTALASSISPSLNRATVVSCQAGNSASKCCCSRCSKCSFKRCPLQKESAISSFDEEASPYILQPIKLNSRENSSEEYMMLKIERSNSDNKQENGSIPNGGILVENIGDFTDSKHSKQKNGTTQFPSRVQHDSGCTELNSDEEEPTLNGSRLSEAAAGEQPSSIKRTGICQFTSEPSVDSAVSSLSQVGDLHVGASESLEFNQENHVVDETSELPNSLDDVQLDSAIHANQNTNSGNKMDQVKITIDRSSPTNTDSTSTTAAAENPIQYSKSHPEKVSERSCPSEDPCISGQINLFHSLPNQRLNFFMKKRHNIHKASSEPTPSDIISSERLVKIEGNISSTPGERCSSEKLSQQPALCSKCKANCKAVSGNFTEEEVKAIVKEHCHEFVKYINWQTLLPFLESQSLLDPDSSYHLSNAHTSDHHKGNYFLLQVLPTKGRDAYKRFHSCITQEREHSGHGSLSELFCK